MNAFEVWKRSPVRSRLLLLHCLLVLLWISATGLRQPCAAVVINEIMYHPAGDLENEEYVELYSLGATTATLTGWRLAGGINYAFPGGTEIGPGRYLVIAKSLAAFRARYPGVAAIGNYSGQLSNAGEEILLLDASWNTVDRVTYDDEGFWPAQADGEGSSLELINPGLDNRFPQSWAASVGGGTPGARNSRFVSNPKPILIEPRHSPAVPRSTNPITITVRAYDDAKISSVRLSYRPDQTGATTTTVTMYDDGAHGDGAPLDGVYGAILPPCPQGTILEFRIRATDNTNQTSEIPSTSTLENYVLGNFLLQVDNEDFSATSPTYRLVMKADGHYQLHTRSIWSEVLLNATFICDEEIFYNVGVRYRGKGSRGQARKSYRVQFTEQQPFRGTENMNLNAQWITSQYLSMDLFRRAGMPAPSTKFAHLVFKYHDINTYAKYYNNPSAAIRNLPVMGWRIQMQDVNKDFLREWFAGHEDGNLYRAYWPIDSPLGRSGDLTYYDTNDYRAYQDYYLKKTNEQENDYSDVIRLCYIFTKTPDGVFTDTVAQYIDTDEWLRFWSLLAMINIKETTIYNTAGDDYYMYFDPATLPPITKAILLPWDLDEAYVNPTETIFACQLPRPMRFISNPDYTPKYFQYIELMLDNYFRLDIMGPKIESLSKYYGLLSPIPVPTTYTIPADTLSTLQLTQYVEDRISYLESVISRNLVVNVGGGAARVGSVFVSAKPTVTLSGRAVTALTRWVTVNGQGVPYDHLSGNWGSYSAKLNRGMNTFEVECLTTGAAIAARKTVSVFYGPTPTSVCGALTGATSWTLSGSPYLVSCDLTVPTGATLTIGPGSLVMLWPGCSLFVRGTLRADGSARQPITFTGSPQAAVTLISRGAVWKYNDSGTDLGTAWRDIAYVDNASGWRSGPAQLGYGDGDEATIVSYGSDPNNKYPTCYFRHTFDLPDPTIMDSLRLRVLRDDGCVIYLNGAEIVRSNMPYSTVTYNTWATAAAADETAWYSFPINPALLVSGKNVIAVEVHQNAGTSGDLSFDLELSGLQSARWGTITLDTADTQCRLVNCDIERAGADTSGGYTYQGALSVVNSSADVENCRFQNYGDTAIAATSGTGIVTIRSSLFDIGGKSCIRSDGYLLTAEGSTFTYRMLQSSHAMEIEGRTSQPVSIHGNSFLGAAKDVILLENADATITSNVIHSAVGAGIVLGSSSSCSLDHNVIYDCGNAILVRNGSVAVLDHNTLCGNNVGIWCGNNPVAPGGGGGNATVVNTIIWASPAPITLDAQSVVSATYSDIAGGWTGEGNFNLDPQFFSAADRDFRIKLISPCRDQGQGGTYVGAYPASAQRTNAARWKYYR